MATKPIDDAARAEQRQWFEQFNPRAGDDADQARALKAWLASHPNARPLPRWFVVCLLIALGSGLAFFLAGIVLGLWVLALFGGAEVALVMAAAIKAGE